MSDPIEFLESVLLPNDPSDELVDAVAAQLDAVLDSVCGKDVADDVRGRAAFAWFRCFAWDAATHDREAEREKCLVIKATPPAGRDVVARAWIESDDPHAGLFGALVDAGVDVVVAADAVAVVCGCWALEDPFQDPRADPRPREARAALATLLRELPALVAATRRWLPSLSADEDRLVLHAGAVFATALDAAGLDAVRAALDAGHDAERAEAVWALCKKHQTKKQKKNPAFPRG